LQKLQFSLAYYFVSILISVVSKQTELFIATSAAQGNFFSKKREFWMATSY